MDKQRRKIVNWHRQACRFTNVGDEVAMAFRPKPPPSDIEMALKYARLNLYRGTPIKPKNKSRA